MVRSKRERFLVTWYSQIARKMGKCKTSDGACFLSFFRIERVFKKKNSHFILVQLVNVSLVPTTNLTRLLEFSTSPILWDTEIPTIFTVLLLRILLNVITVRCCCVSHLFPQVAAREEDEPLLRTFFVALLRLYSHQGAR